MKKNLVLLAGSLLAASLGCSQAYLVLPTPLPATPGPTISSASGADQLSISAAPSSTPITFPTPDFTATPLPPTSTPIPGWSKFEGGPVDIWLPSYFIGGDASVQMPAAIATLQTMYPGLDLKAMQADQNSLSAIIVRVFDPKPDPEGGLTYVSVYREDVAEGMSLGAYVDTAIQNTSKFGVADRQKLSVGPHSAERILITDPERQIKDLAFFVKEDTTIWSIYYNTHDVVYDQYLPIFESSILTFNIHH